MRNIGDGEEKKKIKKEYQSGGTGGTHSPLTAPQRLEHPPPAKSKIATRGPQNCRQGLEKGPTLGYWTV